MVFQTLDLKDSLMEKYASKTHEKIKSHF